MPSEPSTQQEWSIKISGRSFTKGLEFRINESIFSKTAGSIRIDLSIHPEFRNVDFKDHIEIYIDKKLRWLGIVKNFQVDEKLGIITFEDERLRLENEPISAEFLNVKPIDRMALITQSSGILLNPHRQDEYNYERNFFVIIPIQNLETKKSFKIGNVKFYQEFDGPDDLIIRDSKTGKKNRFWTDCPIRAIIKINAVNFFEAVLKGYEKISQAIDIIALRTDLSFPSMAINSHHQNFSFNYYTLLSKVKVPTTVYCRQVGSHAALFYDMESISEKRLALDETPLKFFDELILLCTDLIVKKELTHEEENLLQVLHWLRKAMQEGDKKDKFLDLWIAFDFLISGESAENLFSDDEKEKLKKIILSDDFNEKQKSAIVSKINMLNDSPLMERFFQIIQNLEISFSVDEIGTLKKMRGKRTHIIHGKKDITVTDGELAKMRTILEKLFIGKINALKCREKLPSHQ